MSDFNLAAKCLDLYCHRHNDDWSVWSLSRFLWARMSFSYVIPTRIRSEKIISPDNFLIIHESQTQFALEANNLTDFLSRSQQSILQNYCARWNVTLSAAINLGWPMKNWIAAKLQFSCALGFHRDHSFNSTSDWIFYSDLVWEKLNEN